MRTQPILIETIACIQEILGADLDRITVERVAIGLFFTGVKLILGNRRMCNAITLDPRCGLLPEFRDGDAVSWQIARSVGQDLLKETAAPSGDSSRGRGCCDECAGRYVFGAASDAGVDLRTGVDA